MNTKINFKLKHSKCCIDDNRKWHKNNNNKYNNVKYYFPKLQPKTSKNIDVIINKDEMMNLQKTKSKIDKYYNSFEWEEYKKFTNPYEMIYITNKKHRNKSISSFEPLSRSFFKMIEMVNEFIPEIIKIDKKIITVHLAEGPGGFIEALCYLRKKYYYNSKYSKDSVYGMTLISDRKEIPSWRRSSFFLSNNRNVSIVKGLDGTGNLYNIENQKFLQNRISPEKAILITGDGGFDFSIDYNKQEYLVQKLIYSQIISALGCQKIGGIFICKLFDTYTLLSIEMIYLLYCLYDEINIYKPLTSRPANSEKYIICKGFGGINPYDLMELRNIQYIWNNLKKKNKLYSILRYVPDEFKNKIKAINTKFYENQCKYVNKTIELIENRNLLFNKDKQVNLAIQWCCDNNIPIRNSYNYY